VGFEPAIPMLELAKTFPALDCMATVIGSGKSVYQNVANSV
jgi:hypothetical protein